MINASLFHHKEHSHKIRNVNDVHAEQLTFGARIADKVASTVGSWRFIIVQSTLLLIWLLINITGIIFRWDPYPFILLNLMLSFQAAYTGPVVMMSQNRQSEKDRLTVEETYHNTVKEAEETRGIIEHLSAQDTELLKQTQLLEQHTASIEKLMRQISKATGGVV